MISIDEIRKLIEKKGRFGKADKEMIAESCMEFGVDVPSNEACNNCWRDACIMIVREANNRSHDEAHEERRNVLKGDTGKNGVIFKGRFVSNAVMTDELAEWLRGNGFPERWWL